MAGQAGAVAAPTDPPSAAPFALRITGAAIEPEVQVDLEASPVPAVVGYSTVLLQREHGASVGSCEARGQGVGVSNQIEEGSGGPHNAAPRDPGPRSGIFNPTEARDTAPPRPTPRPYDYEYEGHRTPQIRDARDGHSVLDVPARGQGVRWEAACADDAGGRATAADVDLAGAHGAGSATAARVDRTTGEYVATARAYLAGLLTPGGVVDLVTSVVLVRRSPGREPRMSYRIALDRDTLASGVDVPAGRLLEQFARSTHVHAPALGALAQVGLTLMEPRVDTFEQGRRSVLKAPFLELAHGPTGSAGADARTYTRLVNCAFEEDARPAQIIEEDV